MDPTASRIERELEYKVRQVRGEHGHGKGHGHGDMVDPHGHG